MTKVNSFCLFIIGIFCIHQGVFRYKFWENSMPGSGFIPVIASILLTFFCINIFMKNKSGTTSLNKRHFYPIIGSLLLIGSIQLLGMILSIAVFMVAWLALIEKFKFSRAAIYGIATTVVIYMIFKVSLNVPLPKGLMGI